MNMGTGAGGHVCSEILGPIGENRPVKKKILDSRCKGIDFRIEKQPMRSHRL
jgi:hypothetical protein